jgi:hypothetical protein
MAHPEAAKYGMEVRLPLAFPESTWWMKLKVLRLDPMDFRQDRDRQDFSSTNS